MTRVLSIFIVVSVFVLSGCNMLFRVPIGVPELTDTETFIVNEAIPMDVSVTTVFLAPVPSNGSILLGGDADGLASGEIQYNVTNWKPVVALDESILRIEQTSPENNISSTPKGSINTWDLKLGETLENITISLSTGDYTLTFADTLPAGMTININAGVGNLRLEFPAGISANVDVHRGPASVATEGMWTKDGKVYISDNPGPVWTVTVDFGVGNLTLVNQ